MKRTTTPKTCQSVIGRNDIHCAANQTQATLVGVLLAFLLLVQLASAQPLPIGAYRFSAETNILYRSGTNLTEYMQERCQLDVYYPANVKNFPTIVWFHGGGLTEGNRSILQGLKGKGVAVVAASYRLSPKVKAPAYIEDAAAAVAWTFRNIERYGGSTNRIFVSGASAGGYLTLMIGLDKRWLAAQDMNADGIAGLIPVGGQTITHFAIRAERGIGNKQTVVDDLAPLYHVRKDAPPLLLITGDRELEMLGRYEENAFLWRMMKLVGHPDTQLCELQGFDHGHSADPGSLLMLNFVKNHLQP